MNFECVTLCFSKEMNFECVTLCFSKEMNFECVTLCFSKEMNFECVHVCVWLYVRVYHLRVLCCVWMTICLCVCV